MDGAGLVTGLQRRGATGFQWMPEGGNRGLTPHERMGNHGRPPVHRRGYVENICALAAMGMAGIGTYTAGAGTPLLAELLTTLPAGRDLIIVSDRDEKDDGTRPGYDGASQTFRRAIQPAQASGPLDFPSRPLQGRAGLAAHDAARP